jgi:hypothetical protein
LGKNHPKTRGETDAIFRRRDERGGQDDWASCFV